MPANDSDNYDSLVKRALGNRIGFVSDILGAVGFYGLAWGALKLLGKDPLLGVPVWLWALVIGTLFAVVLVILSLNSVGRGRQNRIDDLVAALDDTERRLRDAERASAERPFREMQKRAVEAASLVFGFHLEKRRHVYTVYSTADAENGSAACSYEVQFRCNRRSLGSWWRTARSSLASRFEGARNHRMPHPFHVTPKVEVSQRDGMRALREEFSFFPTIQAKDGIVPLTFEDKLPGGTFLTRHPNAANRKTDYVSFSPREPLALLEVEVEFDDFKPTRVYCDAVYGPAQQPLAREAVDVEESLTLGQRGTRFAATLSIPYPLMGVEYRLWWELPNDDAVPDRPIKAEIAQKKPPGRNDRAAQ